MNTMRPSEAGKGDDRRPAQVPPEEVARRWERTFGCQEVGTDNDSCHGDATDDTNEEEDRDRDAEDVD